MLVKEAGMDGSPSLDGFACPSSCGDWRRLSCRAAAARFGVAPSTAIRWVARRRETGSFASKPQGGDIRS